MENFNFNPGNFLLGLLSGWASAYAVYRARHVLSAAQESVSRQASSAQEFASRSADRRYIQDLTKYINSAHLLGDRVPLTDLIVEPYFIRSEPIAAPPDEDVIRTVFHVVPNIPDHPYIQAPYNVETMSIEMLARGSRAISLLGRPGSGKTTALFAIALWSIGEVNFDPPSDAVQERLSEEEQNLNDEQRAERIRNFVQVEQLRERAEESGEAAQRRAASFRQLTPIYVHLADVRTDSGEFGRRIDPAEPLVRAAQKYTTRVTRQTMAGNVYERMAEGKALLLLDGYEDLPAPEQQNKLRWFRALLNTYPDNFYITTGPVIGYGSISDIGFDPVFIRPWNDVQINRFVENWSQAWPRIAGQHQRGDYTPPPDILEAALRDNRIRSPFDLTVKLWGNFTDAKDESYESWIRGLLGSFMGNEPIGTLLPKLAVAAQSQLDSGYVSVGSMVDLASGKSVTYTEPAAQEPTKLVTATNRSHLVVAREDTCAVSPQADMDMAA